MANIVREHVGLPSSTPPGLGSTIAVIDRGDRFTVIITGMGTRNAEAKADALLGRAALGARRSTARGKARRRARDRAVWAAGRQLAGTVHRGL